MKVSDTKKTQTKFWSFGLYNLKISNGRDHRFRYVQLLLNGQKLSFPFL